MFLCSKPRFQQSICFMRGLLDKNAAVDRNIVAHDRRREGSMRHEKIMRLFLRTSFVNTVLFRLTAGLEYKFVDIYQTFVV